MMTEKLSLESLFGLKNKVALVTGGSGGIGRMIAQGLLVAGAIVYITGRKNKACEQAAHELSEFGSCIALAGDITDEQDRQDLLQKITSDTGKLNILINNAGSSWGDSYENYPAKAFAKLMDINVGAVFTLTRDLTPLLEASASGHDPARVINIGSMDGLHTATVHGTGTYAYAASKAAVHQLTKNLAVELGPRNITVNAVAPGFFVSKMTSYLFDNFSEQMSSNSLLNRVGKVEEMAGIAIYLCSQAGAYTHGTIIPVDGGTSINHQHTSI